MDKIGTLFQVLWHVSVARKTSYEHAYKTSHHNIETSEMVQSSVFGPAGSYLCLESLQVQTTLGLPHFIRFCIV